MTGHDRSVATRDYHRRRILPTADESFRNSSGGHGETRVLDVFVDRQGHPAALPGIAETAGDVVQHDHRIADAGRIAVGVRGQLAAARRCVRVGMSPMRDRVAPGRTGGTLDYTISNDRLTVAVRSLGAELQSLRTADGHEYLWQGDARSWTSRAPLLFPIVGGLAHDGYRMDNRCYPMTHHGFARTMEFSLADHQPSSCRFVAHDNDATRRSYPFAFRLGVAYSLREASLVVEYGVENLDRRPMWFSIGGHPGFACPIEPHLRFDDYRLEFEKPEHVDRIMKGKKHLSGLTEPFLQGTSSVPLSHDLFKRGAIILRGLESDTVRIASPKGARSVEVSFPGFPYLGIWSASVGADFVCIEPWFGVDSTEGDPPEIEAKQGIERLEPGNVFRCKYTITVG